MPFGFKSREEKMMEMLNNAGVTYRLSGLDEETVHKKLAEFVQNISVMDDKTFKEYYNMGKKIGFVG